MDDPFRHQGEFLFCFGLGNHRRRFVVPIKISFFYRPNRPLWRYQFCRTLKSLSVCIRHPGDICPSARHKTSEMPKPAPLLMPPVPAVPGMMCHRTTGTKATRHEKWGRKAGFLPKILLIMSRKGRKCPNSMWAGLSGFKMNLSSSQDPPLEMQKQAQRQSQMVDSHLQER